MLQLERIFRPSCSWPWGVMLLKVSAHCHSIWWAEEMFLSRGEAAAPQGHSEGTYKIWLGSEGFHKVSPWRVPRKSTGKECKCKQSPHYLPFYSVSSPKLLQPQCDIQGPRPNKKFIGGFSGKKERERNLGKIHRNIFELQFPRKDTHPIWKYFTLALTTYQIIPPGNLSK